MNGMDNAEGNVDRELCTVHVVIAKLSGEEIRFDMAGGQTLTDLNAVVSEQFALAQGHFRLVHNASEPADTAKLTDILPAGEQALAMQLLQVDPMLELNKFVAENHEGIVVLNAEVLGGGLSTERSMLRKTNDVPDSNNVLLSQSILMPCFVEFEVSRTQDEMLFGVTNDPEKITRSVGHANMYLDSIWTYAKQGRSLPIFQFGSPDSGARIQGVEGFVQGDCVAIYVDPVEKQIKFFRNKICVADNLPDNPLPDVDEVHPLRIYTLVDAAEDEIRILRFGPGEPYPQQCQVSSA